jgi:hypothetical protein
VCGSGRAARADAGRDVPAEGWVCHAEMYAVGDEQPGPSSSGGGGVLQQSDERANAADFPSSPAAAPPPPAAAPGTNMTAALRGATVTHALKLELGGRKALVFAFTDLSSSAEGAFALRYRAFNVLAPAPGGAVAAACAGAPFTVYSTRTFPGLGQSTELTKVRARRPPRRDSLIARSRRHSPRLACTRTSARACARAGRSARKRRRTTSRGRQTSHTHTRTPPVL